MSVGDVKDLLGLLSDRSSAWQGLWTLLYTVSAALITLVASGKFFVKARWRVSALVTAGFLFFAAGNYDALYSLRIQREALVTFAGDKLKDEPQLHIVVEAAAPPGLDGLRIYHWGLCAAVVAVLFVIPAASSANKD